ncbi:MAG: hypothetical protein Q8N23_09030 [Archangium sp.]|nr:hypothetical protein [Archangium sp.]MDP3571717.1 hypothetical protein [Archangium sp.]
MGTIDKTTRGSPSIQPQTTRSAEPAPAAHPLSAITRAAKTTAQRVAEGMSSFVDDAATAASRVGTHFQANYEANLVERQETAMLRGGDDRDRFDAEIRAAASAGLVSQSMVGHLESMRGEPIGGPGLDSSIAVGAATAAAAKTDELSDQLHATLEQLAPATTEAERAAMTAEFRAQHEAEYTAHGAANLALSEQLTALSTSAVTPGDAQAMVDGLAHLAKDPTYTDFVATQSAALIAKSTGEPWQGQAAGLAEVAVDVATTRALSAGGDPNAVLAAVESANKALSAVALTANAPQAVRQMTEARALLSGLATAATSSQPGAMQAYLSANADAIKGFADSGSPLEASLGRFTATLGTVRAIADVGVYLGSEHTGSDVERLGAMLATGGSAAEVVALGLNQTRGLMHAVVEADLMSKGAAVSAGAALRDTARGLTAVAGYLGAGSAVLGTVIDVSAAIDNPSVGNVGKAIGSSMAAAGAVASLVGANTIGGPIAWTGSAISLGSWAYQAAADNREYLREGAALVAPHLGGDQQLAEQLMSAHGLDRLAGAGLSVDQIRAGVSRLESEAPGTTWQAAQIIQRSGASAEEAAAFLAGASPAYIDHIADVMSGGLGSAAMSPEELRAEMAAAVRVGQG